MKPERTGAARHNQALPRQLSSSKYRGGRRVVAEWPNQKFADVGSLESVADLTPAKASRLEFRRRGARASAASQPVTPVSLTKFWLAFLLINLFARAAP